MLVPFEFDSQNFTIEQIDLLKKWAQNNEIENFRMMLSTLGVFYCYDDDIQAFLDKVHRKPELFVYILEDFFNEQLQFSNEKLCKMYSSY